MKKLFLFLLLGCTIVINAQENPLKNTLGLRLGGGTNFMGELSFQHPTVKNQRLEADLGSHIGGDYAGATLAVSYQWVYHIERNYYWYIGFGGVGGYWANNIEKTKGPALGLSGVIGLEYHFKKLPLQLSLDSRPEGYFLYYGSQPFQAGLAVSLRYVFKNEAL